MEDLPMTGRRLEVTAYHGSDHDDIVMDEDRGVFFSTDEAYAASYGAVVGRYAVTLENPIVVTEEASQGMIEIDRNVLIEQGYDGRVVAYEDGSLDVVAFEVGQFELDPVDRRMFRR